MATAALAQAQSPESQSSIKVNLPPDAPVSLLSADMGESRAAERGGALVLHLNTALVLRNSGSRRIRGITWMVQSQEVTPGGRASVTKASLDVAPGETFPVRVDLRLLRPLTRAGGSMVEMSLDGVLFDDLTFYGPNRLDSRRVMLAFEMEAQRERRHFFHVYQSQGAEGLRREVIASIDRQGAPRLDVQLARGRATAASGEREVQFAFLRFPEAPVEPVSGMAFVSGAEARAPRVEVSNRSSRPVRYLELSWLVKDGRGHEFLAGTVPSKAILAPGQKLEVLEQSSLRFQDSKGAPVPVESMTGFVSQVEFSDGAVWIPNRGSLTDARLQRALAPSAEEQRLTSVYRKKGLNALVDELKRLSAR